MTAQKFFSFLPPFTHSGASSEEAFSSSLLQIGFEASTNAVRPHERQEFLEEQRLVQEIFPTPSLRNLQNASVCSASEFFNNIKTAEGVESHHKDFYINLVVLLHAFNLAPESNSALRTKLVVRILNYCYKFSTYHSLATVRYSTNPVQEEDWEAEGCYHRCEDTNLRNGFSNALSRILKIPVKNIKPVTSPQVHSLLKRNYVLQNNSRVLSWKDGGALFADEENSSEKNESYFSIFPNISELILHAMSVSPRSLYFDISESLALLAKSIKNPQEVGFFIKTIQNFLIDVIEYGVSERIKSESSYFEKKDDNEKRIYFDDKFKNMIIDVCEKIVIGGVFKINNQYVLYNGKLPVFKYFNGDVFQKNEILSASEMIKKMKDAHSRFSEIPIYDEKLRDASSFRAGFTPSPIFIMESWFGFCGGIESIFSDLGIKKENILCFTNKDKKFSVEQIANFSSFS
ncbi:MAG: hypothetical protein HC848_05605 [Limnobacter sp.]|nr:hypothetical protein [Limnobacter sp.]